MCRGQAIGIQIRHRQAGRKGPIKKIHFVSFLFRQWYNQLLKGRGRVRMNYIIVTTVLVLDQLSKILALKYLKPVGSFPIINNIFRLTYVENRGAAFGILQNQKLFFIIFALLVLGFIWFYTHNNRLNKIMIYGLSLATGGIIGNLIDRVRLGFVVDYLHIANFPVFNIADSAVTIGIALISIFIFKYDKVV